MKKILFAGALMLILGCTRSDTESRPMIDRDTLTRRQKDSIIATLPLPGAKGVGAALRSNDRAQERADRLDSLLGGRK